MTGLTDVDATMATLATRNLAESMLASLPADATVLIAGTGLAVVAEAVSSSGRKVVAVDPSAAVLETLPKAPGLVTRQADLAELPLEDHSVDAAVLVDAVNRLGTGTAEQALAEVARVLREAGILVASSPSDEPGAELLRFQLERAWPHVTAHRQLDVGGFVLLPASSDRPEPTVVAGRPLTGSVRWVYTASAREVPSPGSLVHLAPEVPRSLTAGMHELLTEHDAASRRLAEAHAVAHQLRDVQQRLVEAEQIAGRARELEAALIDSRARIAELHGMIDTILRSTSWRMTEPVRRASGVARSMTNKFALDTVRDTVRKYRQG